MTSRRGSASAPRSASSCTPPPVPKRSGRWTRWACACSATSSCTTSRPRSAGPRACSAGSVSPTSTSTRPAVSTCCARASKECSKARDAGRAAPVPIAVTVLTSDPDASAFDARLASAIESGCGGVVCSVQEIAREARVRISSRSFPAFDSRTAIVHDQARVGTPGASRDRGRRRARDRSRGERGAGSSRGGASDPRLGGRRAREFSRLARAAAACKPSPSCGAARDRYAGSSPSRVVAIRWWRSSGD